MIKDDEVVYQPTRSIEQKQLLGRKAYAHVRADPLDPRFIPKRNSMISTKTQDLHE